MKNIIVIYILKLMYKQKKEKNIFIYKFNIYNNIF
jgi:hypothetical protein